MSATGEIVDVGVVGLGLIGSATVRHVATAGASVVGVGPAEPPVLAEHVGPFASHYDSGRITRVLDDRIERAILAQRSIAEYRVIEAASRIAFHRPVGMVMAVHDADVARSVRTVGEARAARFRSGTAGVDSFDDRFALPLGSTVFHEGAPAGHIDPRRMLAAQLAVASDLGGQIVRTAATHVERRSGGWRIHTAGGSHDCRKLILSCGPHADEITGAPRRPAIGAFAEVVVLAHLDADEAARLAGLPSLICDLDDELYEDAYMVPPTDYPDGSIVLKLGATLRTRPPLSADARRAWMRGADHDAALPAMRSIVEHLVPGIRATSWSTRPCLIATTPTDLPMVDQIDDDVFLAAGGNGFGAKSADAIGALGAGLCLAGRWNDTELMASSFRFVSVADSTS